MEEIVLRWAAYRRARQEGYAEAPTYDWALHPRTRVSVEELVSAYPDLRE